GDQFVEEGKLDEAIGAYSKAIEFGGYNALPYVKRAAVLAKQEDYEGALRDYKDALDRSPNFAEALAGRGKLLIELGANDQALGDLQLAIESDRTNPEIIFNLGKVYTLLGGPQQGLKLLDRY